MCRRQNNLLERQIPFVPSVIVQCGPVQLRCDVVVARCSDEDYDGALFDSYGCAHATARRVHRCGCTARHDLQPRSVRLWPFTLPMEIW